MKTQRLLATAVLAAVSGGALAHPGHEHVGYFSSLLHPLGGLEYLLAALAVGAYALHRWGK